MGHLSVVRMLIDAKAKIDAVNDYKCEFFAFNDIDIMKSLFLCVNSVTSVYWAACEGNAKVVHWLAKVRYYVSVRDFFIVRDILF